MEAVSIAAQKAFSGTQFGCSMFDLFMAEVDLYKRQIASVLPKTGHNPAVNPATQRRISYWVAKFEMSKIYEIIRFNTGRAVRFFKKKLSFG